MPLLSTVIKVAPVIARYAKGFGKFTSGETAFVGRFPPRYRDTVRTIIKGASTVTYGGLISDIIKGSINDDGTPNGNAVPKKFIRKSNKFNQTRYRRGRSSFRKYCKCKPNRRGSSQRRYRRF